MSALRSFLHRLAVWAESVFERFWPGSGAGPERLSVIPYLGHGTTERVVIRGRVLTNSLPAPATGVEPLWRRMRRSIKAFLTDEVGGVEVVARIDGIEARAISEEEGYFRLELGGLGLPADRLFHELEISIGEGHAGIPVRVEPAEVMVPTPRAKRLVISDIDDTVLETGAQRTWQMIVTTLTGSSWTRAPFPGAARLYSGLGRGPGHEEDNPFFYVSSSPWNLYSFLQGFIERSVLPTGPLFLRDLGIDRTKFIKASHDAHKREAIEEILETHDLPAVLIGDTGQRDPEIYAAVASAHPGRIEAILLRHVAGPARRQEVQGLLSPGTIPWAIGADSLEMAGSAEGLGLIPPEWRSRIGR
jgi:phosphatidate phosphatase APP1